MLVDNLIEMHVAILPRIDAVYASFTRPDAGPYRLVSDNVNQP